MAYHLCALRLNMFLYLLAQQHANLSTLFSYRAHLPYIVRATAAHCLQPCAHCTHRAEVANGLKMFSHFAVNPYVDDECVLVHFFTSFSNTNPRFSAHCVQRFTQDTIECFKSRFSLIAAFLCFPAR